MTNTNGKYQAKSTNGYNFDYGFGHIRPTEFGIFDTEAGKFIRFLNNDDLKAPYMPKGGRKACLEIAKAWNVDPADLHLHITTVDHMEE